jgi:quercetin dioxygenase-like cupin family protein
MKRVIAVSIVSALLIGGGVGLSLATPGSGIVVVQFGRSTFSHQFKVNQADNHDIVVTETSLAPLGFSGWHSHPGKVVIGVQRGAVTLFRSNKPTCTGTTYVAGQVFVEFPSVHYNAVNESTTDAAVVNQTYFNVPMGQPTRIDQPEPPQCQA